MLDAMHGRKSGAKACKEVAPEEATGEEAEDPGADAEPPAPVKKRGRPPKALKTGAVAGKTRRKRTSAKTGAAKAMKVAAAPKVGVHKTGKPCFSVERTRSQVQCRNPNWAIKYGKDHGLTEKQAVEKASKWLKTALKKWSGDES